MCIYKTYKKSLKAFRLKVYKVQQDIDLSLTIKD